MLVERDCVIEHNGQQFESGGAYVDECYAIGYTCAPPVTLGRLRRGDYTRVSTWHGDELGTARVTAAWRTPHSYMSSWAYQLRVTIGGRHYTGRTAGPGCIWRGKVAACCKSGTHQAS